MFYECLLGMKVFSAAFLLLRFGFGKSTKALSYEKRACKMLMKLATQVVNSQPECRRTQGAAEHKGAAKKF